MSKVLYIKANPKPVEHSYTFKISEAFIYSYKSKHPNDNIITLDLYKEDIKFFDSEMIQQIFNPTDQPFTEYSKQFASADLYVIAAPMWNLSSPAILKAYLDYVVISGITFKYTENGPVGLLKNKKAVHIVARGGQYTEGPFQEYEMGDRYLRTIMGFMGVSDITTISLEQTAVLQGEQLEAAANKALENAKTIAQSLVL